MQSASVNGVNLEYETSGSGEPVALIHLSPFADSFLPLIDRSELANYRLVRYHRRGYVGSSRVTGTLTIHDLSADLASLLNYLGIKRAHIAGHSIGGIIALQLAVDHPELVGSLILMEPALVPFRQMLSPESEDKTRLMSRAFQLYKDGDLEGAVQVFFEAIYLAPGFRKLIDQISPGGWVQTVKDAETFFGFEYPAMKSFNLEKSKIEKITVPMLSVRGVLSNPEFRELEELLRDMFINLEYARIPDADHLLHMRQPDLVAKAIAEFLSRHPLV